MSQFPPNSLYSLVNTLGASSKPQGLGLAANLLGSAQSSILNAGTLGNGAAAETAAEALKWIYVTERFAAFQGNLALTSVQVSDGVTKYKGVVSCLNAAYWGSISETANSFLIGSWAKDTRIRPPRDVDLYFVLPKAVYERFQNSGYVNKQSALLQEVKGKLLASYPTSSIRGDGPVVLAGFTSYNVEIVPAFLYDADDRSYYVCDTKNGGSYKTTKPLHEAEAIETADKRNNVNVRRLVRMLKCWQAWCSVPIKSFYLELLAINFLDQWAYREQSYFFYDWMCRDFFSWMNTKADSFVMAPGTYEIMWIGNAWKSRAESAHLRASKACDFERENKEGDAGDEWQKIFGTDIPKWI